MRGIREVLVSVTVGIATVATLAYLKKSVQPAERRQSDSSPTQITGLPEDPALSLKWGLQEIGAPEAWMKQRGSKNIVVAIIDTGGDIHHPDLHDKIWRNPGESGFDENGISRSGNGIDDDGNGFVDDVHGWNFVSDSPGVMDDHGHGTHIAGIVGSVAPDVSLMILKYYDSKSSGIENLSNTIRAIRYAVRMGAKIINYSGGGILKSSQEEDALAWAASQGVLVVAAAGNEGLNSDFFHFYPANYDLPNIISVGATDREGQLLKMSNHGIHTVDVAAPGRNIYSTLPNGNHGFMSGTSQATAFVSGAAVLMMAQDERMKEPVRLIQHLTENGRARHSLKNRIRSGGLLNLPMALKAETVDLNVAQTPRGRAPALNTN